MIIPGAETPTKRCSRTSCREEPTWEVQWRNPKIHSEDRVKIWLACDGHQEFFQGYLEQRNFPVTCVAITEEA